MSYKLRQYQEKGVRDITIFCNDKSKSKGVVIAPCGAGKSLYIAAAANNMPDKNILVIQPNKELLKQNYEKYISYGNQAAIFSASMNSKRVGKVTFATPLSLKNREHLFQSVGVVFQDECHLFGKSGSVLETFIKKLNNPKIIGLTATPVIQRQGEYGTELKMLNRTRDTFYNRIIHCTQIDTLTSQGYWANIRYEVYQTQQDALSANSSGSEYTDASLDKYVYDNDIENQVIEILKNSNRKNYLIFAPTIKQAQSISERIRGCETLTSKNPKDRDRIVNGFLSGEIKCVVNVNILSVGFDYPELDCIIDYSPTLSASRWYQRWSRGVRIHENKEDVLICDLGGNYERYGKLEDINYKDVEGYGWGMFSGDYCLTAAPMAMGKIHIDSLIKKCSIPKEHIENPEFHFGKYKGKRVSDVGKMDGGYLTWLLGNKEFNWYGQKGQTLKKAVENFVNNYIVNEKAVNNI